MERSMENSMEDSMEKSIEQSIEHSIEYSMAYTMSSKSTPRILDLLDTMYQAGVSKEIPMEKIFMAQKMMIQKARDAGKFVVCATEMLASMEDRTRGPLKSERRCRGPCCWRT